MSQESKEIMPISFDERGNPKPYEIVRIGLDRFEQIYTTIPEQRRRAALASKLREYLGDFARTLAPSMWFQWFGGSYTTTKETPNDIDLVNFIDVVAAESGIRSVRSFLTDRVSGTDSTARYSIDGYLVPVFPEGDARRAITLDRERYWRTWFGKDRQGNPKAIPEVVLK